MKLDEQTLAETPILARLVTDAAVGRAGALELLADDYKPPQPWTFSFTPRDEDEPTDDTEEDEPTDDTVEFDPETEDKPSGVPVEVDEQGYPAIVNIKPVSPSVGVKLIRPRALSDVHQAS